MNLKSVLYPASTIILALPLLLLLSLGAGFSVWSNSPSSWRQALWFQYGDHTSPYAITELPQISNPQAYAISLELKVPLIESNYELGNFMAGIELISISSNKTILTIRKPCLLLRPWFSFLRRSQHLSVTFFDRFDLPTSRLSARVEVGRHDSWRSVGRGQGRELTVQSALLTGNIVPKGIRGWLVRYPLTVSIISSITFFVVSMIGLCIGVMPLFGNRQAIIKRETE